MRVARPLPHNSFSLPLPPVAATRTVDVNGQAFSPSAAPMFTVRAGTIERWNVVNVTQEVHDFHMRRHSSPHTRCQRFVDARIGDDGRRFSPPVIAGEFVFHCHILDHEDSGMMAKIRVVGPP